MQSSRLLVPQPRRVPDIAEYTMKPISFARLGSRLDGCRWDPIPQWQSRLAHRWPPPNRQLRAARYGRYVEPNADVTTTQSRSIMETG